MIALGTVLQTVAAPEVQTLRNLYNDGIRKIEAARASGASARELSNMRYKLANNVRDTGSKLMKQGAEAIDLVRGNKGRPTYESLRRAGRTDAQIVESATKSNKFVNRLPKGLKWTGRGLWFVSGAISVYIVMNTPEELRGEAIQKEVEGLLGGIGGGLLFKGVCIVAGLATEGLGLIACGLIGGLVGYQVCAGCQLAGNAGYRASRSSTDCREHISR